MKQPAVILCLIFVLVSIAPVSAAATIGVTDPQTAASLVYVSGYDVFPTVFYPYESGTITVDVTNAANASVVVSMPALIEPHIHVTNMDAFQTKTTIGPGATVSFPFVVSVDATDGWYYPLFTISPETYGNAIHSVLSVKVDSADVRASIAQKPDNFAINRKDQINVSILNPRDDDILNVQIVPSSPGADVFPDEQYIADVPANSQAETTFYITPYSPSGVTFNVTFDNGDDHRHTSVILPLNIGVDKTAVVPVLNDVVLADNSGVYTLTGDVSNTGITDATGMFLTTAAPATPVQPYSNYAIGSLQSNDFSSFTLTFTSSDLSSVPVIITWKDASGNTFNITNNLDLRSSSGSGSGSYSGSSGSRTSTTGTTAGGTYGGAQRGGGGGIFGFGGGRGGGLSSFYPLIAGGIVVIIAIVLWVKRKAIIARFKKQ